MPSNCDACSPKPDVVISQKQIKPVDEGLDINFDTIHEGLSNAETAVTPSSEIAQMIAQAEKETEEYEQEVKNSEDEGYLGGELGNMMNQFKMQPELESEAMSLEIPQFYFEAEENLFYSQGFELINKEFFSKGFTLQNEDAKISFDLAQGEAYKVDLSEAGDAIPKYQRMNQKESEYIREHLATLPQESKIRVCVDMICK